jgi:hypothetical protein
MEMAPALGESEVSEVVEGGQVDLGSILRNRFGRNLPT